MKFTYDPTCADLTNWERNRDDFLYGGWESDTAGEEWILFAAEGLFEWRVSDRHSDDPLRF